MRFTTRPSLRKMSYAKKAYSIPQASPLQKAAGIATVGVSNYMRYRQDPKYGPYLRKAERYVYNKFRSNVSKPLSSGLTKMTTSRVSATPGDITYSSYKRGTYMPRYFASAVRTSQKYIYEQADSVRTAWPIGEQGVADVIVADAQGLDVLFDRCYTLYGSAAGSSPKNYKLWLSNVKTELRFANPTLSTVSVDLYDYEVRRDYNQYTFATPPSLLSVWSFAATEQTTPTALQYAVSRLGASPLDLGLVGYFHKIRKKTTIQLPPGAEHIHTTRFNMNRCLNRLSFTVGLNIGSNSALTDFTHGTLVVPSGAVIYEQTSPSRVDTAGAALNYVLTKTYEVYTDTGSQEIIEYQDNTPAITTQAVVAVQNPTEILP